MNIALVGNPNCGKTTLFNRLTGSRSKVTNMPGVTVERSDAALKKRPDITLTDLPGTYSLFAQAGDERITQKALLNPRETQTPDAIWLVVESAHIRSSLFLVLQILEMEFPAALLINRTDGTKVNEDELHQMLGVPVVQLNFERDRTEALESAILGMQPSIGTHSEPRIIPTDWTASFDILESVFPEYPLPRMAWYMRSRSIPEWLDPRQKAAVSLARDHANATPAALQLEEAGWRMESIREWTAKLFPKNDSPQYPWQEESRRTTSLDRILIHPIWGNVIVALVFFGIFQAVYAWSSAPMEAVDAAFGWLIEQANHSLPETWWKSLLLDGILSGIAGIVVFVPQIMILFGLTSAMEATGYMARVGFLGDRLLQHLGLSGRSVVPLVGGLACAVPAIMAARSIQSKRERLITILVTPLMTCSARLPVYAFLIGFIVPDQHVWGGMFNQQGLFLFSLYIMSTISALGLAWLMHRGLPTKAENQFTMEWPTYRWPKLREVLTEMLTKGWDFVANAGQVILIISVVIWGLSQFGPSGEMAEVENTFAQHEFSESSEMEKDAALMQASWLGKLGQWIEPAVRPLGYDGRMGIAILSSFAAREVFVGTMSTLFPDSSNDSGSILGLQRRLTQEIHPATGRPLINRASAASLIVFYMYAMQCMSTVVIVRKELDSWPWAIAQAVGFSLFAYGLALLVFQLLAA
ncbi:ferrous iron transport protein B [Flavobacteriales bacterium]|nr:ferrous iron transport protein B [Flavobacteriales bacterium]